MSGPMFGEALDDLIGASETALHAGRDCYELGKMGYHGAQVLAAKIRAANTRITNHYYTMRSELNADSDVEDEGPEFYCDVSYIDEYQAVTDGSFLGLPA